MASDELERYVAYGYADSFDYTGTKEFYTEELKSLKFFGRIGNYILPISSWQVNFSPNRDGMSRDNHTYLYVTEDFSKIRKVGEFFEDIKNNFEKEGYHASKLLVSIKTNDGDIRSMCSSGKTIFEDKLIVHSTRFDFY